MNAPFLRSVGCLFGVKPSDWRQALAVRIDQHTAVLSALIDALDAMDGDADLEPWLGAPEVQASAGFWGAERTKEAGQTHWADGGSFDLEEENEHGGDVQDEPHDLVDERNDDFSCPDELPTFDEMSGDEKRAAWNEAERLVSRARAMCPRARLG